MPRPQFTLRALLVLMLAVGCFFGGMAIERLRNFWAAREELRIAESEEADAIQLSSDPPLNWRAIASRADRARRRLKELEGH